MEAIRRTTAAPKADWVGANGCNSAHAGGRPVARWLAGCAPHTVKVAFPTAVSFADSVADESGSLLQRQGGALHAAHPQA